MVEDCISGQQCPVHASTRFRIERGLGVLAGVWIRFPHDPSALLRVSLEPFWWQDGRWAGSNVGVMVTADGVASSGGGGTETCWTPGWFEAGAAFLGGGRGSCQYSLHQWKSLGYSGEREASRPQPSGRGLVCELGAGFGERGGGPGFGQHCR